jgi:polysaccharide biosynthesis/export protein
MNTSERCHLSWKIAAFILGYLVVLPLGWAQRHGTKSVPGELALNVASKNPGSPDRVMEPNFALIEQVQAIDVGQHVQVRLVSSGALSCTPFRLADPDRLVLDCTGAHVRAGLIPSRVKLDPVVSIRVGQPKTNVARVVVELAGQTPYSVRAEGNIVLVTFDPIHRQLPSPETKTTQTQIDATATAASPGKAQAEQMSAAAVPTVPDKLPGAERAEFTSAGFTRADALPQYPLPLTPSPVPAQPLPQVASESVSVPKAVREPTSLAAKLDLILPDQDYVIGPQDLLAINVWHEPELSQSVPVRPDGKISFPLIGDLEVSGLTPSALQTRLAKELDAFIHKPQVTVIVREVNSRKFYMIGEVERPGAYPLTPKMTVLDALATAGGFRDFAKVQQVYLLRLRPDGSRSRIRFDFKAAVNGKASYRDIELQIGDTVVVP